MAEKEKKGVMARRAAMEEAARKINSAAKKMYEEGMRHHRARVKEFTAAMADHKRNFWYG